MRLGLEYSRAAPCWRDLLPQLLAHRLSNFPGGWCRDDIRARIRDHNRSVSSAGTGARARHQWRSGVCWNRYWTNTWRTAYRQLQLALDFLRQSSGWNNRNIYCLEIPAKYPSGWRPKIRLCGRDHVLRNFIESDVGVNVRTEQGLHRQALVLTLFIGATCMLSLFIAIERRVQQPMLDLSLFRNRMLSVNLFTGWASFAGIAGLLVLLPFYLENVLGYAPREVGLLACVRASCAGNCCTDQRFTFRSNRIAASGCRWSGRATLRVSLDDNVECADQRAQLRAGSYSGGLGMGNFSVAQQQCDNGVGAQGTIGCYFGACSPLHAYPVSLVASRFSARSGQRAFLRTHRARLIPTPRRLWHR